MADVLKVNFGAKNKSFTHSYVNYFLEKYFQWRYDRPSVTLRSLFQVEYPHLELELNYCNHEYRVRKKLQVLRVFELVKSWSTAAVVVVVKQSAAWRGCNHGVVDLQPSHTVKSEVIYTQSLVVGTLIRRGYMLCRCERSYSLQVTVHSAGLYSVIQISETRRVGVVLVLRTCVVTLMCL
jgi:hypothetical protein